MNSPSGWSWSLRIAVLLAMLPLVGLARASAADLAKDVSTTQVRPFAPLEWLVLKAIPIRAAEKSTAEPDETAQKKAFQDDLLAGQGGETGVAPKLGDKVTVNGVELVWQKAEVHPNEPYSLQTGDSEKNYVIAYASAEIDFPVETTAYLGVGSDDHVKVWLNGKLVHQHWISRPVQLDDDVIPVTFSSGKNHLLLKIQNGTGSWGFACRVIASDRLANTVVNLARNGNVDTLKRLHESGVDLTATNSSGLNPYQAARLAGQSQVVAFLTQNGAVPSTPAPTPEKLIDAVLNSHISAGEPGVAILVSRDGKILFEHGYGLADVAAASPVTPITKFRIGSVTKQFTASAILKLAEQGKLKLSDPLSQYYPDFPRGSEVTLRHLLTHTSGIHSYTEQPDFLKEVTKPITSTALIASIQKAPFDFNPGQKWAYCNSGFILLGDIVEKVSGKSYGDFLRETFFEPLGMVNTGIYHNETPPQGVAHGYQYHDEHYTTSADWDMSWASGAGAIYSTVEDLDRWNEAVFGGKVVSAENLQSAFTPVKTEENKNVPSDEGYGYGWSISRFRGDRVISHGGGLAGFSSFLLRLPEHHFTVAVLANALPLKPGLDTGRLAHEVVEIYLGTELETAGQAQEVKALPDAALSAIVGRYDAGRGVLEVTKNGGQVFVQLSGQPRFEIFPKSETEFFLKAVRADLTFVKDTSGRVVKAINHQNGRTFTWPRIEPIAETKLEPAKLDAIVGEYSYPGDATVTITREGDRLYAQHTGQPKFEIFAKSETEFFWRVFAAELTLVKDADGKVIKGIHRQGGRTFDVLKIK